MEVGFIGLGIMGKPMASHLLRAGHRLWVHNRSRKAVDQLALLGALPCDSPAEVAAHCELVFTMLPAEPEVEAVLLGGSDGPAPLIATMRVGSLLVDLSSIAPDASRRFAVRLAARGVGMLDAPVSGGEAKAIDATLTVMVGGAESDFERAKPLLQAMAQNVVLVGEQGSGSIAKLANQLLVAAYIAAAAEALILAEKSGADPAKVYQAIRGGMAGGVTLDAKVPMMLARDFTPGFRLNLHMKDMVNVLATAEKFACSLPLTSVVGSLLRAAVNNGQGGEDHSALIKVFEALNQVQVQPHGFLASTAC